jgi:AcrR family transcriptional regulator
MSVARESGKAKREAIIDAARALFLSKGYEATTIADVASAAGVAVGSVYRHVADKRELLDAVRAVTLQRFRETVDAAALGDGPLAARVDAAIDAAFAFAEATPEIVQVLELMPSDVGGTSTAETRTVHAAIKGFIEHESEAGTIAPTTKTEIGAVLVWGTMAAALRAASAPGADRAAIKAALKDTMRRWRAPSA